MATLEQTDKPGRREPLITERQAKATHWEGKDRLISAGDCLYLNVRKASKTWLIRRALPSGKMVVQTIGKYPTMSVREARAHAVAASLRKVPSTMTVEDLAKTYFDEVVEIEHRRPEIIRGYLDRAILPELGHRRIVELTPSDIAAVILAYRSRGARTADQLRTVMRALFTYAVENGVRPDNPAAPLTRRVAGYRPTPRERVLTDDEIRKVWTITHDHGRLLRFLLLTSLRITEAQKGEHDGKRWYVSTALAKNKKAHWVHLTPTALAQLPLEQITPTGVQAWLRRWCVRAEIQPAFTPHDCRRTAATRMGDAAIEPFIIERVLNHTLQGVMATYNRAEYEAERVNAAQELERVLLKVIADENAVPSD